MTTTTPIPSSTLPEGRPAGGGPPVRDVVVGTDGSECSLRAVRWAAEEADRRGAPLRIVHAAPYLGRPISEGAPPPELRRARQVTGAAYTIARHTAPEVPASTEVMPTEPITALLHAAADGQLLVMGVATTGAADEMVLAPVAQRVAARCSQPVVVVPRHRTEAAARRPLVVALGLGEPVDDEPVAVFAAESARREGRPLLVLHTRPNASHDWTTDPAGWTARYPEVEARHEAMHGVTGSRLLAAACPTPLLALSAGHAGLLHRPLDAVHRWLLRHCTSPMALIPPLHRHTGMEPREEIIAVG